MKGHPCARATASNPAKRPKKPPSTQLLHVEDVDAGFLETLLGYNARRTALAVINQFLPRMAVYDLRPVDFSMLSLIAHNPGITSRQLCSTLGILPPNLVGKLNILVKRGLVERLPHPHDGRAVGLQMTAEGQALIHKAEATAGELEAHAARHLTPAERRTLLRLLRKVYQSS